MASDDAVVKELMNELPQAEGYIRALAVRSGHRDWADDLASSLMERSYLRLDKFVPGSNMAAWLRTMAKNLYYDRLKKDKRTPETSLRFPNPEAERRFYDEHSETMPSAEEMMLDEEEMEDIHCNLMEAVNDLPDELSSALLLYSQGESYESIASILGVRPGTVMSRLSRARGKVAALLPQDYGWHRRLGKAVR